VKSKTNCGPFTNLPTRLNSSYQRTNYCNQDSYVHAFQPCYIWLKCSKWDWACWSGGRNFGIPCLQIVCSPCCGPWGPPALWWTSCIRHWWASGCSWLGPTPYTGSFECLCSCTVATISLFPFRFGNLVWSDISLHPLCTCHSCVMFSSKMA